MSLQRTHDSAWNPSPVRSTTSDPMGTSSALVYACGASHLRSRMEDPPHLIVTGTCVRTVSNPSHLTDHSQAISLVFP